MFFFLSKILDAAGSPLTWVLALLVLYKVRWKSRPLPRADLYPVAAFVVLYAFSLPTTSDALMLTVESSAVDTYDRDATYDLVILLGGAIDGGPIRTASRPEWNDNVDRVTVVYDLLRENRAKRVLITGGAVGPRNLGLTEASVMGDLYRKWGIDPSRILLEERSVNTRENAVFSAEILAKEPPTSKMLLVTSAFHMNRAAGCFRAVGLRPHLLPVDFRGPASGNHLSYLPRSFALADSSMVLREYLGRIVYRLRGYTVPG
ncbi:MAG: YdcF family protein [Polyangiaceae bacterium]